MKLLEFTENSPLTVEGSFTEDLAASKLWLCTGVQAMLEQENIPKLNTIYVLGSWYGNMSLFLIAKHIKFKKIINVDRNPKYIKTSKKLAKELGIDNEVEFMSTDANSLDYRHAKYPSLVINTSCNEIKGTEWFDNIPDGTFVAMQARNNGDSVNQFDNLGEFADKYILSDTYFCDSLDLKDPETNYTRYMIIGIK